MIKKLTGVRYTPQEFRLLNQCTECGKASPIRKGKKCEVCQALNLPKCEICEVVLRKGVHKFYTYDIREEKREDSTQFKVSKEYVKEFTYEREGFYPQHSDTLCEGCKDWEKKMSNTCTKCYTGFDNYKEHYKEHGNVCGGCVLEFQQSFDQLQLQQKTI